MNLKKLFALSTLILCLSGIVNAQSPKEFFSSSETPVTWLGVDFTLVKMVGMADANLNDIRDRQCTGINQVIVNEPKKYDLADAFDKKSVTTDISEVNKRNEKMNIEGVKSDNASDYQRLKPEDIAKLVKGFDFGGKKGLGILFVMEGMSKTEKEGSMYATLVDMGKNKMLMTERVTGDAGGFGFRNYWAGSINKVLQSIDKRKYKEWKEKYGNVEAAPEPAPVVEKAVEKEKVAPKAEKAKSKKAKKA
jgi:hypothetical protein